MFLAFNIVDITRWLIPFCQQSALHFMVKRMYQVQPYKGTVAQLNDEKISPIPHKNSLYAQTD